MMLKENKGALMSKRKEIISITSNNCCYVKFIEQKKRKLLKLMCTNLNIWYYLLIIVLLWVER